MENDDIKEKALDDRRQWPLRHKVRFLMRFIEKNRGPTLKPANIVRDILVNESKHCGNYNYNIIIRREIYLS